MRWMSVALAIVSTIISTGSCSLAADAAGVQLRWLDHAAPPATQPVSWGVPWPQGQVKKDANFVLAGAGDRALPVQSWPLAYWPDGSLKWTGHAALVPGGGAEVLTISPAA